MDKKGVCTRTESRGQHAAASRAWQPDPRLRRAWQPFRSPHHQSAVMTTDPFSSAPCSDVCVLSVSLPPKSNMPLGSTRRRKKNLKARTRRRGKSLMMQHSPRLPDEEAPAPTKWLRTSWSYTKGRAALDHENAALPCPQWMKKNREKVFQKPRPPRKCLATVEW